MLISPWLELKDLVCLDSGSCKLFHASFVRFVKSVQFKDLFSRCFASPRGPFLQTTDLDEEHISNYISSIVWLDALKCNVEGVQLVFDDRFIGLVGSMVDGGFVCDLVTRIAFYPTSSTSWIYFALIITCHFPNVKQLEISWQNGQNRGGDNIEMLSAVCMLVRNLSLTHITINRYDFPVMQPEISLIRHIVMFASTRLEWFEIKGHPNVSMAMINDLVQYCPSVGAIFPFNSFDNVSAEQYFSACQRLKGLHTIDLHGMCGLDVTDDIFLRALPGLSSLVKLSFAGFSVSLMTSLLAVIEHCPLLETAIVNSCDCTLTRESNKLTLLDFSVESFGCTIELFSHALFAPLLQDLECSWSFSLNCTLTVAEVDDLVRCWSRLEGTSKIVTFILYTVENFSALIPMFRFLPCLDELYIGVHGSQEFGQDFADFVEALGNYCPRITTISFSTPNRMLDSDIDVMTSRLPLLTSLTFENHENDDYLLTEKALVHLARANRVWERIDLGLEWPMKVYLEAIEVHGLKVLELALDYCVVSSQGRPITGHDLRGRYFKELCL